MAWVAQRIIPSPDNPMGVARALVTDQFQVGMALTLRYWRDSWWRWFGDAWAEWPASEVRSLAYQWTEESGYTLEIMEEELQTPTKRTRQLLHVLGKTSEEARGEELVAPWRPNKFKIANLLEALAAVTQTVVAELPAWFSQDPAPAREVVAVGNGLLHFPSRRLYEHTPHFFNQVSVPFAFDPDDNSDPVLWLDFLRQLWPHDEESIAALQEWFGYVLSGRLGLHKILLVVGPTRSGKGTIARVLEALIGSANSAGPTLASLKTNFGLAPLIGKPLAVVSDARLDGADTASVVERLLSVSGEDELTIDRKYREAWTGTLPTRFMVLSNELPRFGDASGVIANRFVILNLTESWLGREDFDLGCKLQAELPAILKWALDGLQRLNDQGRMTEPPSSREAVIELQDLASPVSAFVRDRCRRGPFEVGVDELWLAWKSWADDNGHRVGSKQRLGRDLKSVIPGLRIVRPRDGDDRYRAYRGVALK